MSQEIIEAVREIEREKGIEEGTLVARARGRAARRVQEDAGRVPPRDRRARRRSGDFRVFSIELPAGHRGAAARRGARARARGARAARGGDRRASHTLISDDDLDIDWSRGPRGADQARGRHAGELRPHRRADREAGDPAADPRGRARDDVRRVHRPRRARSSPASSSRPATATTCSSTSARSRRCCRAPSRSTASATSRARASRP